MKLLLFFLLVSFFFISNEARAQDYTKSATSVEAFNISVRNFLELSNSTDKEENSRAVSTLHSAIYRLISLHETKPLRQPRAGESKEDVLLKQGEIAIWMRGYYGPFINPDFGSYKETLRHIYEANPNQSLYGAIMGHVIETIGYQQNLKQQTK
ncbi:MAG: hypothetical protein JXR61_06255 [Prolixibacteraceae bacterium]|nr:hypothetical protein [Prolixibacteraceae bacterium]